MWVLVVLSVSIVSGSVRLVAGNANNTDDYSTPWLLENVRKVIVGNGYKVFNDIRRPGSDGRLIGLRFRDNSCHGEMIAFDLHISHVAKSSLELYKAKGDRHRFYYYDYSYTDSDSARFTLIVLWANQILKSRVIRSERNATTQQLGIIWPEGCDEPSVAWSELWAQGPKPVTYPAS